MSMKRKSSAVASTEEPDNKRRKSSMIQGETPETVYKSGQHIATHFMTLPDRYSFPEYYEAIPLPIAIDTIEDKLLSRGYNSMSEVESDLKRMVQNAKKYNHKNSEIVNDAEKVRKNISNHMRKHNPAYQDPNYVAQPTAEPEHASVSVEPNVEERRRPLMKLNGPRPPADTPRKSSTPMSTGAADRYLPFFQKAQEDLIEELMNLETDDANISGPFINLPSRDLKDYYKVITNPLSLKGVQKKVMGVVGREKPTGVTLYKTWQQFADAIDLIVRNAQTYNEDGSEIFEQAGQLKEYFEARLVVLKAKWPEPPQETQSTSLPRVKFTQGPKPGTEINGGMADAAALKRQQDFVAAGANGQTNSVSLGSPAPDSVNGIGASRPQTANGMTPDGQPTSSPAPQSLAGAGSQPPIVGTVALAPDHPLNRNEASSSTATPPDPWHVTLRAPGKNALIQNLEVAEIPVNGKPKNFHLNIPPSDESQQKSTTITVMSHQQWFRITPTFAPCVFQRQHNYLLTHNYKHSVEAVPLPGPQADPKKPVYYDVRLRGTPKVGPGNNVEYEKSTIFMYYVD